MKRLDFPTAITGKHEQPIDLRVLLYLGASAANRRFVQKSLRSNKFGAERSGRRPLVLMFHEILDGAFVSGGAKETLVTAYDRLRDFYEYADRRKINPMRSNVVEIFASWSEYLQQKVRVGAGKDSSAYASAVTVAALIAQVLGLKSSKPILAKCRWRKSHGNKRALGTKADKQNLQQAFEFGHACVDICSSITTEALCASLPIQVKFRTGKTHNEWCRLRPAENVKLIDSGRLKARALRYTNGSLAVRAPAINLRIQAEMVIFIGQTGINPSQAKSLLVGDFRYESSREGYDVRRRYKGRRLGDVEFTIFSDYRPHFDEYLRWRREWIPDEEKFLFPSISSPNRSPSSKPHFQRLRATLALIGVPYMAPSMMRNTRVNWLLRQANDPKLVAQIAQHSVEVLHRVYEKPDHQTAVRQITMFFRKFRAKHIHSAGPPDCQRPNHPAPSADKPAHAPEPDCRNGAGCLFCDRHGDVDTLDYCWNLASFRHLQSLDLASYSRPTEKHPVLATIERITQKLGWFRDSNPRRAEWVTEVLKRVEAGQHHLRWKAKIAFAERV